MRPSTRILSNILTKGIYHVPKVNSAIVRPSSSTLMKSMEHSQLNGYPIKAGAWSCGKFAVRCYSGGGATDPAVVEEKIIDILKGFDKVTDPSKVSFFYIAIFIVILLLLLFSCSLFFKFPISTTIIEMSLTLLKTDYRIISFFQ